MLYPLESSLRIQVHSNIEKKLEFFMYRRPTLYPLEIAVDFLKSL